MFHEFREDFEEDKVKLNRPFVRGEVVNGTKTEGKLNLFQFRVVEAVPAATAKPIDVQEAKKHASEVGRRIILEAQQKKVASAIQYGVPLEAENGSVPANRPPKPGGRKEQRSKKSNLEQFKEELKQ